MKVNYIVMHCSDSVWGSAHEIDLWHRDNGWKYIGYHYVILNGNPYGYKEEDGYIPLLDGSIEVGRKMLEKGAHATERNNDSVGVCLIGVKDFTDEQFKSAKKLVKYLMKRHGVPVESVIGHYEVSEDRTCPNFDMDWFREYLTQEEQAKEEPVEAKSAWAKIIELILGMFRKEKHDG